jgi:hypothetical protein
MHQYSYLYGSFAFIFAKNFSEFGPFILSTIADTTSKSLVNFVNSDVKFGKLILAAAVLFWKNINENPNGNSIAFQKFRLKILG